MAARAGLRAAACWDAGEAEGEADADAAGSGWFRFGGVSCPIIRRAARAGLNVGGDLALALALALEPEPPTPSPPLPVLPVPSPAPFVLGAFLADPPCPPQIVSSVGVPAAAAWLRLVRFFRPLPPPLVPVPAMIEIDLIDRSTQQYCTRAPRIGVRFARRVFV